MKNTLIVLVSLCGLIQSAFSSPVLRNEKGESLSLSQRQGAHIKTAYQIEAQAYQVNGNNPPELIDSVTLCFEEEPPQNPNCVSGVGGMMPITGGQRGALTSYTTPDANGAFTIKFFSGDLDDQTQQWSTPWSNFIFEGHLNTWYTGKLKFSDDKMFQVKYRLVVAPK